MCWRIRPSGQRKQSCVDEDCKMEGDCEAASRKKLDQRKREITKQLRIIEESLVWIKWQQEPLQIEQKQNDLLPRA